MPIVMNMEWAGVTASQYDQVRKIVNWEGDAPRGGLIHVAAVTAAGLHVTDVWDTAEDFNRFVETRLMPGVQKAGVPGQPKVDIQPVHALFTPGYRKL